MVKRQKKPFFYFDDLKNVDKVTLGIYIICTLALAIIYGLADVETIEKAIFTYIFGPQIYFIFFLYVSLRNLKSYLIWSCFGLLHLLLFVIFRYNSPLSGINGNPACLGVNTIILLLLFQCFRFVSIKFQRREFVNPAKSMNGKDLIEGTKVSALDYLISIVYFFAVIGFACLSVVYFKE